MSVAKQDREERGRRRTHRKFSLIELLEGDSAALISSQPLAMVGRKVAVVAQRLFLVASDIVRHVGCKRGMNDQR